MANLGQELLSHPHIFLFFFFTDLTPSNFHLFLPLQNYFDRKTPINGGGVEGPMLETFYKRDIEKFPIKVKRGYKH